MWRKHILILPLMTGLAIFLFPAVPGICSGFNGPAGPADGAARNQGFLQARKATGELLGECPLLHTDVKGNISGILASVTVRQDFRNSFDHPIEAVYTFPLPQDAAVDDMTIRLGSRSIRSLIKSREQARAAYEQARTQGKMAALLDQERPNIFSQHIANILPGQAIEVTIRYVETLKYDRGGYSFVFPMVVGPRYIPGLPVGYTGGGWSADTTRVPDASHITPQVAANDTRAGHDISIEVSLATGVPYRNLRSAQHEIVVRQQDNRTALVQLADLAVIPNKDFLLSWDVAGEMLQDGLVTHRVDGEGYFMLILQPPLRAVAEQIVPRELVFVLDTSGSMQGFPIEKAKETIRLAMEGLRPYDTFNLITFSGHTQILFDAPVPATRENLVRAQDFLASSHGSGGTEMMQAIRAALESSDAGDHVRIVCFMTDGYVGNDMEIIAEVQRHPNARVFAFGIGTSVNRFLLDKMAEEGRGAVEYVTLSADAAAAARGFLERVRNPLLTNIALSWRGTPVADLVPKRIPDLFDTAPVVICGRYASGGRALLRLSGMTGAGAFVRDLEIPLPASESRHEVLAKLWARKRIDALMAEDYAGMQRGSPRAEVRDAITELGLRHRLMTQFTSFVAVEERIVTEGGKARRVQVPIDMPEGVSHEGVFGPRGIVGGVVGGIPGGVAGGVVGAVRGGAPPPMAPPQMPEAVRVGGNVQEARIVHRIEPAYPELASKARIAGVVVLEVTLNEKGDVSQVRVLRGHPLLNDAAVQAVKQWKYSPTLLNGVPVPVVATATVTFGSPGTRPRLDPAVALVLARHKAGLPLDSMAGISIPEDKARVKLTLDRSTARLRSRLQALGFEVLSWPESSNAAIGRLPVGKLEALLDIESVLYVEFVDQNP